MRRLEDTQIVMTAIQERQASVQRIQVDELDAVRARQQASETWFERIETNLAKATENLNAIISLVDQHLNEHPGKPQPEE